MEASEPRGGVAVLRALKLGDLLCAVPAFRALRRARPAARVVLIGLPWARSFVARFHHLLDGFLEFPGWPGIPERAPNRERIDAFMARGRAERFDLAIQMHGSGLYTNPFVALLGARETAGHYVPGQHRPDRGRYVPYPPQQHEVRRNLRLLEALGIPPAGDHLEFPITAADREELAALRLPVDQGYVVLHPGSADPSRRWPPERFAAVADALGRDLPVVVTGTEGERDVASAVGSATTVPVSDVAGRTGLGALAALLEGARLLVSNDTGVSHLAAALGVPSVVVFTSSDPRQWAPLDGHRHRVLTRPSAERVTAEARALLSARADPAAGGDPRGRSR